MCCAKGDHDRMMISAQFSLTTRPCELGYLRPESFSYDRSVPCANAGVIRTKERQLTQLPIVCSPMGSDVVSWRSDLLHAIGVYLACHGHNQMKGQCIFSIKALSRKMLAKRLSQNDDEADDSGINAAVAGYLTETYKQLANYCEQQSEKLKNTEVETAPHISQRGSTKREKRVKKRIPPLRKVMTDDGIKKIRRLRSYSARRSAANHFNAKGGNIHAIGHRGGWLKQMEFAKTCMEYFDATPEVVNELSKFLFFFSSLSPTKL